MEKDFCIGILVGLLGGALAAANSYKVRNAVTDGQEKIITMLKNMNDERKEDSSTANTQE